MEEFPFSADENEPDILKILEDDCLDQAKAIKMIMLKEGRRAIKYHLAGRLGRFMVRNKLPLVELDEDFLGPFFESKPFGLKPDDEGAKGWKINIRGELDSDTFAWAGSKMPPMHAFAHFSDQEIGIYEVIVGAGGQTINQWPSGWYVDPNRERISKIGIKEEALTTDNVSELRIILELGLASLQK